jgi:hypothetical protein
MRFSYAVVAGFASLVSGVAFGGEDGMQSVLRQPASTPVVAATAPVATQAAVVIPVEFVFTGACANGKCQKQQPVCANGACGTKLYNVEEQASEHCRNRLLGGTVVRKSNRTVYKPVRR